MVGMKLYYSSYIAFQLHCRNAPSNFIKSYKNDLKLHLVLLYILCYVLNNKND